MSSLISCVDRSRLQQMLALAADSEERQALDAHLGQCDACRRLLLEFTSEAMRMTASAAPLSEHITTDFSDARTQDKRAGDAAPTQSRVKESDFLDPPHELGNLGRLAHYELLEIIGRGGMGTVFKAHDETIAVGGPRRRLSRNDRQGFVLTVRVLSTYDFGIFRCRKCRISRSDDG